MKNEKRSEKRAIDTVISVFIAILTIIIVVLTVMLGKVFLSYLQSRKEYKELRQIAVIEQVQESKDSVSESKQQSSTTKKEENNALNQENSGASTVTEKKEPSCSLVVDFALLHELNPDIKAWIYMDALDISYPIVQGEDNNEYLQTSVKGTESKGGSIFMDAWNHADFKDPHTLVYGHNMKDKSMFGGLKDLYDQEFIDNLDTPLCFWVITPEGKYRYDVFSIHTVDAAGDAYTIFSGQGNEVGEYLNEMARQTGVKLPQRVYNAQDKAVTLSTCTGNDAYRLIVQGILYVE